MSKGFRDETKILPCGCKIGRAGNGIWFYDYICDIHIPEVLKNGKYCYDKALKLTEKLNKELDRKHE